MVERCVRDAEVASSNLVTSTIFLSNRIFMRFVCLLPVSSLPCRYRPSACFRRASLRAWARPSAPRCGSGLLLLVGSFLFGFHCFSSLSLILGIKIPPSWSGKIIKFGSDLHRTSQKTAVFAKFVFKSSAIDCTRV